MRKRGKNLKKDRKNLKRRFREEDAELEEMDDDIDAFHKQRDIVPLDINADVGDSDEDDEQPVFDFEDEEDSDDDDKDEDSDDDAHITGFAAKIVRQQKFLRAKFGGVDDEMHDADQDGEEEEEEERVTWGGVRRRYYNADNTDFELQSSDDESLAEEEAEALRLQRKAAESLTMADVGLGDENQDESDKELTLEEISIKGKGATKYTASNEANDELGRTFEKVKKDISSLSREEQMDVVYSSAPELVGLMSELNDALEQLENKINPLLIKVQSGGIALEGGMRYLEVKQLLLLSYCQAIAFYLLLKSEGQSVCDHPVIARLVEIKGLLDKMKELDGNLPSEFEEILKKNLGAEAVGKLANESAAIASDSVTKGPVPSLAIADGEQLEKVVKNTKEAAEQTHDANVITKSLKDLKNKGEKRKFQDNQVGVQSMKMLKIRAALEENLRQRGLFSSIPSKPEKVEKKMKSVNGKLETFDDFDDDAINVKGGSYGLQNRHADSLQSNKLSAFVTAKPNKPKVVSGDDDLPKRDDIGERRRKHELRVLAGAGVMSQDEVDHEARNLGSDYDAIDEAGILGSGDDPEMTNSDAGSSEDEFYKQVKKHRDAKLAAKAEIYTRTSSVPSLSEIVDGKRLITSQMEKNRGLTRKRKKHLKNPRKKYRTKHEVAVSRRKGQVRDVRKPIGPYGGESTGINAGISRSVRFKN